MTSLSPDQLQAIQAFLQQNLAGPDSARSVPVEIQLAAINTDNLSRLLVLEGRVIQAGLDQILFRTAQGEFQLRVQQPRDTALFNSLSSSSGVSLQLRPGPNGLEAVLVLDGKAAQPDKALPTGSVFSAPQTLTFEIPKAGQVFQATMLPSSLLESFQQKTKAAAQALLTQTQAQHQNNATLRVANAPRSNVQVQALQPNFFSALIQRLGFTSPQNAAAAFTAFNAGENISPVLARNLSGFTSGAAPQITSLKIISVLPPTDTGKAATLPPPPAAVALEDGETAYTVTVRGQTPSGQTLILLGDSLLAIKTNNSWPTGTQLKVTLGPLAGLTLSKDGLPLPPAFENLRQIIELLARHSPALAAEIMRLRLPQTNPAQMPGALLFLFAALQKNSFNNWFGDEVAEKLKELGRSDLLQKLQEEGFTRQQVRDTYGNEWLRLAVPWYGEDRLQAFRFYIHQNKHEKSRNKDDDAYARRFLIDMALSRFGSVQLEGLVRKKKIELALRTDAPLPESLRNELRVAFHHTMEEVRYTGELRFQAHKAGWVEMKERNEAGMVRDV